MYINPVLLPPVSNREDFLLTLSIFDDDTGDAINLSGTSLATPGAFTGNSWTVTDGAIVTPSITPITIPYYPIGNQLEAISLTVGAGLGILAGDPVTVSDPTGLNTMTGYVLSYVPSTGALVCQIGVIFEFEIRPKGPHRDGAFSGGYTPFYDIGTTCGDGPALSASLGNGITIIDQGFVQVMIPAIRTQQLRAKSYLASMIMTDSVNTRQLFIGELPMLYGGVGRQFAANPAATGWANEF